MYRNRNIHNFHTSDDVSNVLNNEQSEPITQNLSESNDSIQTNDKSGWCYVGTDRSIRSCLKVGINDYCHSEHIYPSQNACLYPR